MYDEIYMKYIYKRVGGLPNFELTWREFSLQLFATWRVEIGVLLFTWIELWWARIAEVARS